MIAECDIESFAHFTDPKTGLNIPILCQLIFHKLSSNFNEVYEKSILCTLKTCQIFHDNGIFDQILLIICDYVKDRPFELEYEKCPRSVHKYNANYYCDIKKVLLYNDMISLKIEAHGDGSLRPRSSSLICCFYDDDLSSWTNKVDTKFVSLSSVDIKKGMNGVITFDLKDFPHQDIVYVDFEWLQFEYLGDGEWQKLFDYKNKRHQEFIQYLSQKKD